MSECESFIEDGDWKSYHQKCSDEAICNDTRWTGTNWSFFKCDNAQNQIVEINVDSKVPIKLNGPLLLDFIPESLQRLHIFGQTIPKLDCRGLFHHNALKDLTVKNSKIIEIVHRDEIQRSSLEMLYLDSNEISGELKVADWVGPELRVLSLANNKFTDLTFRDVTECALQHLNAVHTLYQTMDFRGIERLTMDHLDVTSWGGSQPQLRRLDGISELERAAIRGMYTYQYLSKHHDGPVFVCSLRKALQRVGVRCLSP